MTNIYDWLDNTHQPSYAPTSPPFMFRNGSHLTNDSTDDIMPLDIDEEGNMYFDYPHAQSQSGFIKQSQINAESALIDPALGAMTNLQMPSTSDQATVTVPAHLVDVSRKILVYLAQVIEVPEVLEEDTNFTTEELEILEPIAEEDPGPTLPSVINGVCVNDSPLSIEIKDVIDLRRIGPSRQIFYLARTIDGDYYWFHIPRSERDHRLQQLIGEYRHKSRMEATERNVRERKELRSGRIVGI